MGGSRVVWPVSLVRSVMVAGRLGKERAMERGNGQEAVCVCCCLCWGDVGDPKWQGEGRPGKVSVLKVESVGAAALFLFWPRVEGN